MKKFIPLINNLSNKIDNRIKNVKKQYSFKLAPQMKLITNKLNSKIKNLKTDFSINIIPKVKSIKIKDVFDQSKNIFIENVRNNDNEVVLKQSRFWARSITWTLISTSALGLGWLAFAQTEEIVIARGKLEPSAGVIEVQMPLEGITSELLVEEGQKVVKGEILIKLDTELTNARKIAAEEKLEINQNILNKLELLVNEGAVSELQYLEQKKINADLKSELSSLMVTLKYQEIIAPKSGLIFDLKPNGPGYVANTTEPMLKIVPTDNLKAKIEIDSSDIGFVSIGKNTDISIDSFPASDFGVVNGVITKIGSDALPPDPRQNKGYRFPADIKLNGQFLQLNNGKKLPLQAGMSLTANIKLRKVSYLQLLLGTFKQKTDSLKEI